MITPVLEGKNIYGKRVWLCSCACGKKGLFPVAPAMVATGKRKSCNCLQFKGNRKGDQKYTLRDYVGKPRNNLTPIKEIYEKGYRYWLCSCSCGSSKLVKVTPSNFCNGGQKSCGCLNNRKGEKHHSWKGVGKLSGDHFSQIKTKAESRKLSFDVTIKELWELYQKQKGKCALSGLPIEFSVKHKLTKTASLDRIDSSEGYKLSNVQWVHKDINWLKNKFTQDKFITLCKAVAKHNP